MGADMENNVIAYDIEILVNSDGDIVIKQRHFGYLGEESFIVMKPDQVDLVTMRLNEICSDEVV
jgi:hypothetical protein